MSHKGNEEFEKKLAGIAAKHAHLYQPRSAALPLREFKLAPEEQPVTIIEGHTHTTILAGTIEATRTPPSDHIGQQFKMAGTTAPIYFTPEVARQWIAALGTIAKETE